MAPEVRVLTVGDLYWPLGTHDNAPRFLCKSGNYTQQVMVDPYPAYAADMKLVEELVAECWEKFPLTNAVSVNFYVLNREILERINAITYEGSIYYCENGEKWEDKIKSPFNPEEFTIHVGQAHTIVLSGKRIPIHPAMVRYLVAHEYGHAAWHHARRKLGYREHEESKLVAKYMELRGVKEWPELYGGGKWHVTPTEIIANDFRILFTGREVEFWPHPDVAPPDWDSPAGEWWKKMAEV